MFLISQVRTALGLLVSKKTEKLAKGSKRIEVLRVRIEQKEPSTKEKAKILDSIVNRAEKLSCKK